MIKYKLYEDGGKLIDGLEIQTPLKVGHKIVIDKWKFKVLRVTRPDLAVMFFNAEHTGGVAYVKRIRYFG